MAVAALSKVTNSLEQLLKLGIEERLAGAMTINVGSFPPEDVPSQAQHVNIYLFHCHPDGEIQTKRADSAEANPNLQTEKAVMLYYMLTAHHNAGNFIHLAEQDLIGHALATLMDYGEINDQTRIGATTIFVTDILGNGNHFEIEILKKNDAEALNFWGVQDGMNTRPSLYFRLRNVRLEPLAQTAISSDILSIGGFIFPSMGPRILQLSNLVNISPPIAGAAMITHEFRPALIFLGAPAETQLVKVIGQSIDALSGFELKLNLATGEESHEIDFDQNAGQGWSVSDLGGVLKLQMSNQLARRVDGSFATAPIAPGAASLQVIKTERFAKNGHMHEARVSSPPYAFSFHPYIEAHDDSNAGRIILTIAGDFDLQALAGLHDDDRYWRLALFDRFYRYQTDASQLAAGEFAVTDVHEVTIHLFADVDMSEMGFLRFWINDCETQPYWVGAGL